MRFKILSIGTEKIFETIYSKLSHNHQIYQCYSPIDALSVLEKEPIDILITQFKPSFLYFLKDTIYHYPDIAVLLITEKGEYKEIIPEMENIVFEYAEKTTSWDEIFHKLNILFEICRYKRRYRKSNIFNIMTPYILDSLKKLNLNRTYKVVLNYLDDIYKNSISFICEPKEENRFLIVEASKKGEFYLSKIGCTDTSIEIPSRALDPILERQNGYLEDIPVDLFLEFKKVGFKKSFIFPLTLNNKVFGLLIFIISDEKMIETEDIELLYMISKKLSFIIDHVDLLRNINRLSRDLRQSQDIIMHQQRLKILGQMASGISHDLNNLIFPIIGFTELLLEREHGISRQGRRYLYQILNAAEDIKHITARLRKFYKKREDIEDELRWIDLNEIVKEAISLVEAKRKKNSIEKGINIEIECELSKDIEKVKGVESEIREALINLLFNAIDAIKEKEGKIKIKTWMENEKVKLSVEDNGIGMDEETLKHCLEPFFTTKKEKGTGLGLSIVYGIVDRHHGSLEIKSKPGEGTKVIISFPLIKEEEEIKEEEKKEEERDILSKSLKILFIDDDSSVTSLVKELLSSESYNVTVVNDGEEGVELFNRDRKLGKPFDIVITDFVMPKMSGKEVAEAIKAVSPETPVILLTGWDIPETHLKENVDLILRKPIFPSVLREVISHFVSEK